MEQKKGRIQVFDPTSTYEKHALWEGTTNINKLQYFPNLIEGI